MSPVRNRKAGVASVAAVAVAASSLTYFAVTSKGETVHEADLNDGGVWVSSAANASFARLVDELGLNGSRRFLVANRATTTRPAWPAPEVREMVIVPLMRAGTHYGWLAAFNHTARGEFSAVEANLLSSVSAILGIHRGNSELYGEQAELMCNMVQALTSAIDRPTLRRRGPVKCGPAQP